MEPTAAFRERLCAFGCHYSDAQVVFQKLGIDPVMDPADVAAILVDASQQPVKSFLCMTGEFQHLNTVMFETNSDLPQLYATIKHPDNHNWTVEIPLIAECTWCWEILKKAVGHPETRITLGFRTAAATKLPSREYLDKLKELWLGSISGVRRVMPRGHRTSHPMKMLAYINGENIKYEDLVPAPAAPTAHDANYHICCMAVVERAMEQIHGNPVLTFLREQHRQDYSWQRLVTAYGSLADYYWNSWWRKDNDILTPSLVHMSNVVDPVNIMLSAASVIIARFGGVLMKRSSNRPLYGIVQDEIDRRYEEVWRTLGSGHGIPSAGSDVRSPGIPLPHGTSIVDPAEDAGIAYTQKTLQTYYAKLRAPDITDSGRIIALWYLCSAYAVSTRVRLARKMERSSVFAAIVERSSNTPAFIETHLLFPGQVYMCIDGCPMSTFTDTCSYDVYDKENLIGHVENPQRQNDPLSAWRYTKKRQRNYKRAVAFWDSLRTVEEESEDCGISEDTRLAEMTKFVERVTRHANRFEKDAVPANMQCDPITMITVTHKCGERGIDSSTSNFYMRAVDSVLKQAIGKGSGLSDEQKGVLVEEVLDILIGRWKYDIFGEEEAGEGVLNICIKESRVKLWESIGRNRWVRVRCPHCNSVNVIEIEARQVRAADEGFVRFGKCDREHEFRLPDTVHVKHVMEA